MTKDDFPISINTERCVIRRTVQEDLDQFVRWPPYPWPYDCFNFSASQGTDDDKQVWWRRIDSVDRCSYTVVLSETGKVIGMHAFVRIDWENYVVGNMGIRIHPEYCDMGYGAETLKPLLVSVLDSGIQRIRLDVAATNKRAIASYQNAGMKIVDEFWNLHDADPIDPDDPKWAFALPHMTFEKGKWLVRFCWMEIT